MSSHRHLTSEQICEQLSDNLVLQGAAGCDQCEAEAGEMARLFGDLRRAHAEADAPGDWDQLLLRRRIREAVGREKPHSRSWFDRLGVLRPVLVSAVVAGLVFAIWIPFSPTGGGEGITATTVASRTGGHLPAWKPLPDESEDDGLAVLAEWTPNEDEITIARCRAACSGALSPQEEENLFADAPIDFARTPIMGPTPL